MDRDQLDILLAGCPAFGAVGLIAHVEDIVRQDDFGACVASFAGWRRRRARNRLFRSWLDVPPARLRDNR